MCRVYSIPPIAVYGCAGCLPFHCQQNTRAGCLNFFNSQQNERAGRISFHQHQYGRVWCTVSLSTANRMDVQGVPLFKMPHLSGILSVRYRNEQKCRCRSRSGTGIRGPSPVPECSGTGLRYRMPECRCRRHRPRCQCPAKKPIFSECMDFS
jgi:hypothetical protein